MSPTMRQENSRPVCMRNSHFECSFQRAAWCLRTPQIEFQKDIKLPENIQDLKQIQREQTKWNPVIQGLYIVKRLACFLGREQKERKCSNCYFIQIPDRRNVGSQETAKSGDCKSNHPQREFVFVRFWELLSKTVCLDRKARTMVTCYIGQCKRIYASVKKPLVTGLTGSFKKFIVFFVPFRSSIVNTIMKVY